MDSIARPELDTETPPARVWGRVARLCALSLAASAVMLAKVPLCPFAALTHTPCPGCGMTRATWAIAGGDLEGAWQLHPFAFVVSPLVAGALVALAWSYLRRGYATLPPGLGRPVLIVFGTLFAAMLAFWVARFFGLHGGPVPV